MQRRGTVIDITRNFVDNIFLCKNLGVIESTYPEKQVTKNTLNLFPKSFFWNIRFMSLECKGKTLWKLI